MRSSTVATYQTLLRVPRLQKFDPTGLKGIIVDEAHRAAAPFYRHTPSHFNSVFRGFGSTRTLDTQVLSSAAAPPKHSIPIIGFFAPFSRHNSLALGSIFDRIVYHQDFWT